MRYYTLFTIALLYMGQAVHAYSICDDAAYERAATMLQHFAAGQDKFLKQLTTGGIPTPPTPPDFGQMAMGQAYLEECQSRSQTSAQSKPSFVDSNIWEFVTFVSEGAGEVVSYAAKIRNQSHESIEFKCRKGTNQLSLYMDLVPQEISQDFLFLNVNQLAIEISIGSSVARLNRENLEVVDKGFQIKYDVPIEDGSFINTFMSGLNAHFEVDVAGFSKSASFSLNHSRDSLSRLIQSCDR